MRRALCACFVALVACASPRTELVVLLDSDLAVPAELDAVRIEVTGPRGTTTTREGAIEALGGLPITLGVEAGSDALVPVVIVAHGLRAGTIRATRIVHTGFVRGERRAVPVFLGARCVDHAGCAIEGESCERGACVRDERAPSSLPPWDGERRIDGGALDAPDASIELDASRDAGVPLPFAPPRTLAAGHHHTCAVRAGSLWCWGGSDDGQVGPVAAPVARLVELPSARAIVGVCAGEAHTCAWDEEGALWCLGAMREGGEDVERWATPTRATLPGAVRVAACGYEHACAIVESGDVWCWGSGARGSLGAGTERALVTAPVLAASGDFVDVEAGQGQTCARDAESRITCWGENTLLEAGASAEGIAPLTTVPLLASRVVARLGAGGGHSCAATSMGLYCWGSNTHFERGDGARTNVATPTLVHALDPLTDAFVDVSAGLDHSCAITLAGGLSCVGNDDFAQLGRGDGAGMASGEAIEVVLGGDVASVAAGRLHTCAQRVDGTILCWGHNQSRQAGPADAPIVDPPMQIPL